MNDFLLQELLHRYPVLDACSQEIAAAAAQLVKTLEGGHFLYLCGNGGSAADAEHIAGELMKSYLLPRPLSQDLQDKLAISFGAAGKYLGEKLQTGLPVVTLTGHYALATAVANDIAGELVFAQQLMALGKAGDALLAITTSGNSANVCHAVRVARALGLTTIGLSGRSGGIVATLCDLTIRVPETETFRIQELHLPVYHYLCAFVEHHFFAPAVPAGV